LIILVSIAIYYCEIGLKKQENSFAFTAISIFVRLWEAPCQFYPLRLAQALHNIFSVSVEPVAFAEFIGDKAVVNRNDVAILPPNNVYRCLFK